MAPLIRILLELTLLVRYRSCKCDECDPSNDTPRVPVINTIIGLTGFRVIRDTIA